jgi:hypothetical protein
MRFTAKTVVLAVILVFSAMILAEGFAFAQCPPGFRWSHHYGGCVPMGPPPPPPPPPGPWGRGGGGCNRSYQNCLMVCGGIPSCVTNCNIGYNMCLNGRR